MNPRLRAAILAARAENMPKDNIERAIKKAAGGDAENYEEIRYEGYAPGGVAVIVEALTDNRNRTAGEVRSDFTKAGGAWPRPARCRSCSTVSASSNTTPRSASEDAMMEAAIEAGADDVSSSEDGHEIVTSMESLREVPRRWRPSSASPARRRSSGAAEQRRGRRRGGREDPAS